MKQLFAITLAVFTYAYSQVALAGAVGPWLGNLNPAGAMVYYGSNAYSKAQSGLGRRWNPDLVASLGTDVSIAQKVILPAGSGAINTTLSGLIKPAGVIGAVGSVLGGPVGLAFATLAVLPGVLDWLLAADARPAPPGSATPFERKDDGITYRTNDYYNTIGSTPKLSCEAAAHKQFGPSVYVGIEDQGGGNIKCQVYLQSGYPYFTFYVTALQSAGAGNWVPALFPDFSQKLSGVPVTTKLINDLLDAGYKFPLDGATASGPAQVAPPDVVEITQSQSSTGDSLTTTKKTSEKTDVTYSNAPDPVTGQTVPTVTASTSTSVTTNVFNNTTNTAVSNTTTTANKPETPLAPADPAADTALPGQPKLYTKKYPDGITGVWRTQKDLMANSPLFTLSRQLMPSSVGSSGSCPSMPVNLNFAQWANFGVKDVAPPCQVWDWGRAICIVSACLLARRLIFGG